MPPAIPNPEEDDYDSAADSDFGGSLSPSSGDESSASDNNETKGTKTKGRKKRTIEKIDSSGDEGVVKEGTKRRRKKGKVPVEEAGLEESAIGMRVRERKLGRVAEEEKKPLATAEGATVNVDALWERLNSAPPKQVPTAQSLPPSQSQDAGARQESKAIPKLNGDLHEPESGKSIVPTQDEDSITIKRTYVFAGETITEEKIVPRSSAEARLYSQSQEAAAAQPPVSPIGGKPLRRPKKRASMFEPNPEGIVKGLSPTIKKGPKLNTIEKSKLDWASHVDKEGLKEELDVAEKAKDGYLGRMDFLGRSEAKREEEMKNARKK